jgi:putative N-acetylmannosamine-6-phosphate epimerase/predicted NBD/HSP70 family sugar kinase
MTGDDLRRLLREAPLVASVQGSPGSPVEHPETLLRLAQASIQEGVKILRLEGVANIETIRPATGLPVMGLIKRPYPDSPIYVTATSREVDELIACGTEMVALDATRRPRPNGENLIDLVARIHAAGRLAMGDCDDIASIHYALAAGCDLVSTTLAGYTENSPPRPGPDLGFLREAVRESPVPVLAEGRFAFPAQVTAAMRIGAAGVVVGGALNDPIKQTRTFMRASRAEPGLVGAVDLGGTWLRFGVFSEDWRLLRSDRTPTPETREEREDWIRHQIEINEVVRLGVSSGGTIDPATGVVIEAKPIIPDHEGARLSIREFGVPTVAMNDGLATAWGHGCLPQFAGRRVATLALGTGVGCGFVSDQKLWIGPHGEYPRLNDLSPLADRSFEDLLGGASLTPEPTPEQMDAARYAAVRALRTIQAMWMPEAIVLCGGVGLAEWLELGDLETIVPSPLGAEAGLYGAAAMALWPPF